MPTVFTFRQNFQHTSIQGYTLASMADSHEQKYRGIEIFDQSTQRVIVKEVEKRVQDALNKEQRELQLRRERLRRVYEEENHIFTDLRMNVPDQTKKFNEMKRKILETETQRERERLELVKQKRVQQKFANCEEIRTVLSKQQNDAVKRHQLWQINEKLTSSKKKCQDDHYYHELILNNVKDALKCDEEATKEQWERKMSVRQAYKQQMEYTHQRKQEEIREREKEKLEMELIIQRNREIETAEERERCKRREKLAEEMKEMLKRETNIREQRRAQEREMRNEIEIIRSQQKDLNQASLKQELDSFMTCLSEMTARQKAEEKRFDEKLEELRKVQEKGHQEEKRKIEQARNTLYQSVLEGREQQLRERNDAGKIEKASYALEQQRMLKQIEEYQNEVAKKKVEEVEKKRKHAEHLKQQIRERELKKARKKEEEMKLHKAAAAGETRLQYEFEDLALNPPDWDKHPLQGIKSATYFMPMN